MTRTLTMMVTALLMAATACDRDVTPQMTSVAFTADVALPLVATDEPFDGRSVIVTSVDGAQEEVVYLSSDVLTSPDVEEIEIPAIILSALTAAPGLEGEDSGDLPSNVSLIVSNEDGSEQEEVVLMDSDEPEAPSAAPPLAGELVVAVLLPTDLR